MARVARLTPRFIARLRACGVKPRSDAAAAVGATISAIAEAGVLPGVLDTESMLPPTRPAIVRRVAGRNLWLWFELDGNGDVRLLTVTRGPPTPHE